MLISRSCSWCHRLNASDVVICPECGHQAHVARLDCRCPQCHVDAHVFWGVFYAACGHVVSLTGFSNREIEAAGERAAAGELCPSCQALPMVNTCIECGREFRSNIEREMCADCAAQF